MGPSLYTTIVTTTTTAITTATTTRRSQLSNKISQQQPASSGCTRNSRTTTIATSNKMKPTAIDEPEPTGRARGPFRGTCSSSLKHQGRGKMINKLALVLLSLVILELVLIGDQVQPVKAIKKKIFLKKLKKMLPLLALIKPKKKIILLPIPIPMQMMKQSHFGGMDMGMDMGGYDMSSSMQNMGNYDMSGY